jgi:hypothetical protein
MPLRGRAEERAFGRVRKWGVERPLAPTEYSQRRSGRQACSVVFRL